MPNIKTRRKVVEKVFKHLTAKGESASPGAICKLLVSKGVPLSEYTVRGDLKALGLKSSSGKDKRPYTSVEDEEIISVVLTGRSQTDLAESLGRSEHSIYYRVRHLRQDGKLPESPKLLRMRNEEKALEAFDFDTILTSDSEE